MAANGGIAFHEQGNSRRVYLGFAESSWEYDERLVLPRLMDSVIAWLRHKPMVYKSAWPDSALSAQLLEMDTEDKFSNALNFAAELDASGIRGTFYCLTSLAVKNRDIVKKLSEKHEIAYHGEVHVGFKGKSRRSSGRPHRHHGYRDEGRCGLTRAGKNVRFQGADRILG
jgi:hypothetical protein